MATFTLSTQAYCKILLHTLKYPHSAVNGVLLGEKSKMAGDSSNLIQIVDVVPLFHRWLSLSTPLEIALSQIDLFCQTQTKNLKIVGYYQANERLKDNSPDQTALKVMEKLTSLSSENILIMVDNSKISLEADSNCLHVFCLQDQKLRPKETEKFEIENEEQAALILSESIQTKLYRELVDFENHFDHLTLDFWNKAINEKIKSFY